MISSTIAILKPLLAILAGILALGFCVFFHELGHYLAALARGMKATRFSVGMGPKIFSWVNRRGTEFRLSWVPFGGYVALPQLSDMGKLEGSKQQHEVLPPVSYADKVIVSVAGAFFNVCLAFILATILWVTGQRYDSSQTTTEIGCVSPTFNLPDGRVVRSPAAEAGLRIGDVVRSIDGQKVQRWPDITQGLAIGSGIGQNGQRVTILGIERAGGAQDVTIHPLLAGDAQIRKIGILPAYELIVGPTPPGAAATLAGLRVGDRIERLDGVLIRNSETFDQVAKRDGDLPVVVKRNENTVQLLVPSAILADRSSLPLETGFVILHVDPVSQVIGIFTVTVRTMGSLFNRNSDIGLSKMSGPIGVVHIFSAAARTGVREVLWLMILVNIGLAVFNLLPIPVLDGGHVLFATIGKLRGKTLPLMLIQKTQSVFIILLLIMVAYVSFFDLNRIFH